MIFVSKFVHHDLAGRESHFFTFSSATSVLSKVGVSMLSAVIFPVLASTHTSVKSFLPDCITSTDQISAPFTFLSSTHLILPQGNICGRFVDSSGIAHGFIARVRGTPPTKAAEPEMKAKHAMPAR